jgi:hypothetical protein
MVQRIGAIAPARRWAGRLLWSRIVAALRRAEPVELIEQRYNFLPHSFRWRGGLRRVRAVARVWEQPGAATRPPRRYFEVICGGGGSYILFQDLRIGTWHMSL